MLERENTLEYVRELELFTRFGLFCLKRFVQVDISGSMALRRLLLVELSSFRAADNRLSLY